jgi:hypothetical protein
MLKGAQLGSGVASEVTGSVPPAVVHILWLCADAQQDWFNGVSGC